MSEYPIREIFRLFYAEYRLSHAVTPEQESAAQCIMGCKTGAYGYTVSICPECGHVEVHNASCNNRNCPNCQGMKAGEWVEARSAELVVGIPYFHIVLTVPHELCPLFLSNPKELLGLLMQSASGAVKEVASRPEHLGCAPGTVSVLHTWSQTLGFHPHVHMLVAGGGLESPVKFNRVRNGHFLCPEGKVAGAFRESFLKGLKKLRGADRLAFEGTAEYLRNHYEWEDLLTKLYATRWNVFLKETFNGNGNAVTYLSRYAYRTAISNSRIVSVSAEGGVTISYKDYKDSSKIKHMHLDGVEFIRRFLMHVLPKGFSRIRYGGFLANAYRKKNLAIIRRLTRTRERQNRLASMNLRERILAIFRVDICKCPKCSHRMYMSRSVREPYGGIAVGSG